MRTVLLTTVMLAGAVCMGVMPGRSAPQAMPGIAATKAQLAPIEDVGWRRRYYGRYRYPVPYAYYPPAYDYYYPPPAYGYYAPAYPAYPYAPYASRYYRPYYAPY